MKYTEDETKFSGKYAHSVFQTIQMATAPYKMQFIFYFVIGFVGRALLLSNTNIIGKWADSLINHRAGNGTFFVLLLLVSGIGFLFYMIFRIGVSRLGTHAASGLYDATTYRVSRLPMTFFDTTPVGRIITRFSSDYGAIFRMAGGPLGEFFSIVFDLFLFCFLILLASPLYAPVIALSFCINFFVYKINKNKIRGGRRDHSVARSPAVAHFAETVQGAKIIRIYGKSFSFVNMFLNKFDSYIVQKNKMNMTSNFFSLQMSFVNVTLLFVTALFGLLLSEKGYVSLGSVGVAFTFMSMASATVQMFFEWVTVLEDAMTGTERISEYLGKKMEPGVTAFGYVEKVQNKTLWAAYKLKNAEIRLMDVCVRYNENLPRALNNVSFVVGAGEKVGIIGKTGSGKTSLLQALFHLYPFEQGTVSIAGREAWLDTTLPRKPYEIHLNEFRRAIALISQDPVLFAGTLRENLTTDETVTDGHIFSVIKEFGFQSSFLMQENALKMAVQEKGNNLSVGEKQLVCLLRCLLQNAPVVLMDEATSNIDPHSEEMLSAATQKILKDKTQITIAHRLSTIEHCDRILWLSDGKVMAMDKPSVVLPEFLKSDR